MLLMSDHLRDISLVLAVQQLYLDPAASTPCS
jgi:hypothetical protein